jgi:hypothetical protein
LQARLQMRAAASGLQVEISVPAPEHFPDRPPIDFERKFRYRAAPVG